MAPSEEIAAPYLRRGGGPRPQKGGGLDQQITLAVDVAADPEKVFEILSTAEGQRSFWTANCDVGEDRARFGFVQAPVDLRVDLSTVPSKLVRMTVTSGFPFWEGSTWEWELLEARTPPGTGVLFRHYGFADGYSDFDLGHTAETWALVLDRLVRFAESGTPQPFFVEVM